MIDLNDRMDGTERNGGQVKEKGGLHLQRMPSGLGTWRYCENRMQVDRGNVLLALFLTATMPKSVATV